ncbi:Chromo domain-containing protein 2 [Escovopsis weberi]|uniref:Chromo domain-containing protein 2 n=1 Tax=Escovopsis weberi TaxID=150374 RepID=A0A0M8N533_ESCWE|nr:Chromo domain-containing protein 2 [Escovopsis weberi]
MSLSAGRKKKKGAEREAALSDDEASDFGSPMLAKASRRAAAAADDESDVPVKNLKVDDEADLEAENGEDEDEEELEEDEFVVERINTHMIDEDGSLKFQVKWEGWDKKSDLTWEPEENLEESASEILSAYFESIGGRESIFEESTTAARGKKRGRAASSAPTTVTKRSRRNGVHPMDTTPPASAKQWSPPAGSWEDEVLKIDFCQADPNGKLMIFLLWKNGTKTRHETSIVYKKCPQKMLQFYESHIKIITEEHKAEGEGTDVKWEQ